MEGLLEVRRVGVEQCVGDGAAHVVDHDVEATELLVGRVGKAGDRLEIHQVSRYDVRPAAGGLDVLGNLLELVGACARRADVGSRLGQGHRARGADPPAGAGDDGDLPVHLEAVQNHARNCNRF